MLGGRCASLLNQGRPPWGSELGYGANEQWVGDRSPGSALRFEDFRYATGKKEGVYVAHGGLVISGGGVDVIGGGFVAVEVTEFHYGRALASGESLVCLCEGGGVVPGHFAIQLAVTVAESPDFGFVRRFAI